MKRIRLLLVAFATMVCLGAQAWDGSEGKVYLQNVGSGLWWGAGHSWGTQASLLQHPEYVTLIADGTNFKMESQVSNGGTSYYFNGSYMDNGNPVSLTITASGDYWTIANGSTYYGYDGSAIGNVAGCVLGSGVDANTDNGKWRIFTEAEMLASLANATAENPMDATFLLLNPSYGRNNRNASAWTKTGSNNTLSGGDNTNCVSESWQSAFETKQTATVPNGYYRLTAQTFLREYTATGTDLPYIYINDAKKDFNLMVTTTASLAEVSNYFTNETDGGYYTTTDIVTVTGKSITVGAKGTRTDTWAVWDNFVLQYLGPIDLSEYVTGLANTVSAAEATEGTIPTAAYNAISAVVTENNKTYDNEEDYTNAILAINTAVNTYASEAIVAAYSDYKTLKASVKALNNSIDVTDADALAEAATTADLSSAKAALRSAAVNYLATTEDTNVDITDVFVTNPGFELGNITGWTNSGTQAAGAQGNKVFDNTQGNFYAERWHQNGTVDLNQTVTGLPSGVYEVGAYLYTDTNTGILYANDTQTSFKTSGWYTVRVAIDADGSIKFGASCTLTSSTWICMDGFKLSLVSAGLPDVVAATGKMNAEVATAQTTAIETYNANKTIANYNAAVAAINDAQASVDAYTAANTAITKANTIKEAHNFASTTAAETFAAAIAEIQNNYDENALTTDAANAAGTTLGTVVTAWHGNNNAAAVVYLRDGFALGDFLADPALHVNTWSTEGDTDGSNFSVPFYESWISDANSLPESTLTGTITGLPNGLYSITAWVRVRAKNGVTATDATGITMSVNGGEAVDVTEGDQVGETQFNIKEYTATGLVKQGSLTLNFNIASDANISWLSFKNVKYTKVRDLTPEEAFVAATADDYVALNAAIEAHTLGFEEGEYAPYNNIEAITTIATAKAIDQTAENSQEDVQAATAAITDATWTVNATEVNAVYNGTFAATDNNAAPAGWTSTKGGAFSGQYMPRVFNNDDRLTEFNDTKSAFFIRFDGTNSDRGSLYYYGNAAGYTMPLKANTRYYVKADVKGWGSTGKPQRMNIGGPEGFSGKYAEVTLSNKADTDDAAPQQLLIEFTTTVAGNYTINFQCPGTDNNKHNAVVSNIELKKVPQIVLNDETGCTEAVTYADVTVNRTIKAGNKWNSFTVPFNMNKPDGWTVKKLTASEINENDDIRLTFSDADAIKAGVPYMVKLADDAERDVTEISATGVAVDPTLHNITTNCADMTGNMEPMAAPDGSIIISNNVFLTVVEGKQPNMKAFRAYITLHNVSGEARIIAVGLDDETTGINGVNAAEKKFDGAVYDLSGRKVAQPTRGLYIVNGKKVVIK